MAAATAKYTELPEAAPLVYLSTHFVQAKEYLDAIFDSTSDAIITTDMRGNVIFFSPGAEEMLGRRNSQALGMPAARIYKNGRAEAEKIMRLLLKRGKVADFETEFLTKDGKVVPVSMSVALLRDRRGQLIGTLGISKDISRRVELERQLRELSITDNLTGLFNQRHCRERLEAEVERAKRQGTELSVLVIDLDNFKIANDKWGHLEGDRILKGVADILGQSIRRSVDAAFRYGGDEFVLVLPGLCLRTAQLVARRIRLAAKKKDFASIVGLSIGTASLRAKDSASDLLRRADKRMYAAKNCRR
ncbi:MAG: sensor domain-containing diguanylate cyclase [Elusimicrobiota bacterium]